MAAFEVTMRAMEFGSQVQRLAKLTDEDDGSGAASYFLEDGTALTVGYSDELWGRYSRVEVIYPAIAPRGDDGQQRRTIVSRRYTTAADPVPADMELAIQQELQPRPLMISSQERRDGEIADLEAMFAGGCREKIGVETTITVERQLPNSPNYRTEIPSSLKTEEEKRAHLVARLAVGDLSPDAYGPDEHRDLMALMDSIEPAAATPTY